MVISFDLDDTLFSSAHVFDTEDQYLLQRLTGVEKIRKGAVGLFKELRTQGHSIYIYTTSFRSELNVKLTFMSYGVAVDRVI
ncbi:MAG TPA: HAD family hydrolase, partial [Chryseolinea sp.]